MKYLFLLGFFLYHPPAKHQHVDKEAQQLLERLTEKYDNFESFELEFELKIEQPERSSEVQKGLLIQQGDHYRLEMPDQIISSDGRLVWVYLKNHNEVQIDNADLEDESISSFSPKKILEHFNSGQYDFRLLPNTSTGLKEIEFKPLDEDSEYSKMNLLIQTKQNDISEIALFSKDRSKYLISILNVKPNKEYSDKVFIFNPTKYPGIYIEDLRIE